MGGSLGSQFQPGLEMSDCFPKSWGWQDHHGHSCLLFNQVFEGHPDPTRSMRRNGQTRGLGVGGGGNSEDPGQRESRMCGRTALLGGPPPVCIMTSCRAHCYFSQHPRPASARWPAGWPLIKGKKQALDLFLLQKCSLSFYSARQCFPWLPWYFPFVYMTLPLVTSFKCVFTKRKVRLENNPRSQFFLPKSVPQSCPTIWSYFYLCKCGKRGDISKVNVTRPGEFAWVVRLR